LGETEKNIIFAFHMDNKSFIDKLSERCDMEPERIGRIIDNLCEVIGESIMEEDTISVPSFGSFDAKKKMERIVVHPSSGKKLLVPPKLSIAFRPSGLLRRQIKSADLKEPKREK